MFNKIIVSISTAILAIFCLASGAVAATITPFGGQLISQSGGTHFYTVPGVLSGISDTFEFYTDYDGAVKFVITATNDDGEGGIGVRNLLLDWTTGSGNTFAYTDNDGLSDHATKTHFETFISGIGNTKVLSITGTFMGPGSSYTLTVLPTPLPPAVIAFATAMLGVGFLARRRRKKKEVFA